MVPINMENVTEFSRKFACNMQGLSFCTHKISCWLAGHLARHVTGLLYVQWGRHN